MISILFVVNVDWFFLSHRLPLALEAKKRGMDVTVLAIETDKRKIIEGHGFKFIAIPASRSGTNFFSELKVLYFLWGVYRRVRPAIVHQVGIKFVTYGSLIGRMLKLPKIVNALTGMGYIFINKDQNRIVHNTVVALFKIGFRNRNLRIILQNQDDLNEMLALNLVDKEQLFLIKGSGVDLTEFKFSAPQATAKIRVILPARMLWDKGVGEFVSAAKLVDAKYPGKSEFLLAGGVDMENRAAISESQLEEWSSEGVITWMGHQENMVNTLASAHIVVLPSYREGLPKSLIEACAIGRPIVTTDVPGCREVVVNGYNGILVPAKEVAPLAAAIETLISDHLLREAMGARSRELAEKMFSIDSVIQKTFEVYSS